MLNRPWIICRIEVIQYDTRSLSIDNACSKRAAGLEYRQCRVVTQRRPKHILSLIQGLKDQAGFSYTGASCQKNNAPGKMLLNLGYQRLSGPKTWGRDRKCKCVESGGDGRKCLTLRQEAREQILEQRTIVLQSAHRFARHLDIYGFVQSLPKANEVQRLRRFVCRAVRNLQAQLASQRGCVASSKTLCLAKLKQLSGDDFLNGLQQWLVADPLHRIDQESFNLLNSRSFKKRGCIGAEQFALKIRANPFHVCGTAIEGCLAAEIPNFDSLVSIKARCFNSGCSCRYILEVNFAPRIVLAERPEVGDRLLCS